MRSVVTALAPVIAAGTPLVVCAKGIEAGTRAFMSDIVAECAPKAVPAILSGPSFAADVARGLPTAVTLAASDESVAAALAQALGSATFRPYHSTDLRGAEIGGAAKNVLAIGAGIVAGRELGASATAALITRGFAELVRFGRAYRRAAGDADRALRPRRPGADMLDARSRATFPSAMRSAKARPRTRCAPAPSFRKARSPRRCWSTWRATKSVEMPICAAVAAILDGRMSVGDAIEGLLTRPFRAEG